VRHTLVILAALLAGGTAALAQDDAFKGACDQAAANLAASKNQEVVAALEPMLRDPALAKSPNRDRLCYYLGCAAFALENDFSAGRALSRLAPFDASPYGPHARYLLGRIHHRSGEYTEAFAHYEAVPPAYEAQVAAARKSLTNAAQLQPAEKARLEALVKGPAPDFVSETIFHAGVVLYELKSFPEAVAKFTLFTQKDKRPLWLEEARLRTGMSQVRLAQNAEALKTLQPLQDHPKLARNVRWWMARAILATAEAKPADAAEHLKKAAGAPATDSGPGDREIQVALGDALERAGKPADAVEVYKKLDGEQPLARLVGAHAAAKQYREAEDASARFEKQYPGSALTGEVLLRRADAAFAEAQVTNKPEHFTEALKRYERVLGMVGGASAAAARYRTAVSQYRLGKFAEALENLRGIGEGDRSGDVAGASLLHGDCILRLASPAEDAADAITASKLLKDIVEAREQFGKALASAGNQAPEVTLKLAYCHRQAAILIADPAEKVAAANAGRELYEGFRAQFPTHPLRSVAEYERANCFVLAGDPASGISKLERFRAPPFADTPVAPLANLRHAQLLRTMNQPQAAATILAECRAKHEAALLKDQARAGWVPLIRYHHAAALKEMKQLAEAAQILESIVKEYGASEWAAPSQRLLKEVKP
jgi:cellulose synthase operon protein C